MSVIAWARARREMLTVKGVLLSPSRSRLVEGERRERPRGTGGERQGGGRASMRGKGRGKEGRCFIFQLTPRLVIYKQLTGVKVPTQAISAGVPRALWVWLGSWWGAGCGVPVAPLGFAFSIGLSHESLVSAKCDFLHPIDALETSRSALWASAAAARPAKRFDLSGPQLRVCTQCSSTAAHSEQC
jgi:hypothetical protein